MKTETICYRFWHTPATFQVAAKRSSRKEFSARVEYIKTLGGSFSKRPDLIRTIQREFDCSARQARNYVAEAFPNGLITVSDLARDSSIYSREVEYYLSKLTEFIDDEEELKQILVLKFGFSTEQIESIFGRFKTSSGPWGEKASLWHRQLREEAWRQTNNKINTKEWPKAAIFKCTDCNAQATHYHHPNYAYPLWVEPVCRQCHTKIHMILSQRMLD